MHAPRVRVSASASCSGDGDHARGSRLRASAALDPAALRSGSANKRHSREAGRAASPTNTQCAVGLAERFARAHCACSGSRSLASTRSPASDSSSASDPSPHVTSCTAASCADAAMRRARSRATTSRVACSRPLRVSQRIRPLGKRGSALRRNSYSSAARCAADAGRRLRSELMTSNGVRPGSSSSSARSSSSQSCSPSGATLAVGYTVRRRLTTQSSPPRSPGESVPKTGRSADLGTVFRALRRSMARLGPCPAAEEGGSLSWGGIE